MQCGSHPELVPLHSWGTLNAPVEKKSCFPTKGKKENESRLKLSKVSQEKLEATVSRPRSREVMISEVSED